MGVTGLFTGYFDESGSPDEGKVFAVAGYIATFWAWRNFDQEWGKALYSEGVKIFHMKDFAQSRGEFKKWKDDEPRRRRFLTQLAGIIQAHVKHSFSNAVLLEDYYKVDDMYMFHEHFGEPYPFCAFSCARAAEQWSENNGFGRNVFCIFEDGAKDKTAFKVLMDRNDMIDPVFLPKEATPLQAADFVAWEHCKAYSEIASQTFERFRVTYDMLSEVPHEWGIFTERGLRGICQTHNVPLRTPEMRLYERPGDSA